MSSLAEYIRWYAEFSFYDKPFNDVDNLVLSMLAYYSFDGKKNSERPKVLRRCVANSPKNDDFLSAVLNSRRFGNLMVSDYAETFSRDTTTQFAAMTFHLRDNLYYIAFRGTDNSLVGWREDFIMSYKMTAGQQKAVQYLEDVIRDDRVYIIGGHSKGGHLALYSSCLVSREKQNRIKQIYNNDGPGLCPEVSDVSLVEAVRDRVTVIVPQYCVFGKIFDHHFADWKIVSSSYQGINQHDIISWEVDDGKLALVKNYAPESNWINSVAEKWIEDVAPADRETLVNSIFDTMEARGAETYTEALESGLDGMEDVLKNIVESDSFNTVAKIPEKMLFGGLPKRLRTGKLATFINANQLAEGVIFVIFGLLMIIVPRWAFHIIITSLLGGLLIFQFGYTIRRLYQSHWNFESERTRFYIFAVIAVLFTVIMVKQEAMSVIGSGVAGVWLFITAFKSFLAVKKSETRDFLFWKNIVKTVLYSWCGIFIVLAPTAFLMWFVLALGVVMVIDGVCTIFYSIIQANEKYSEKYDNIKAKVRRRKPKRKKQSVGKEK